MTYYIFKIISLLGGLALFLFGMDVMGKSLERTAGGKLQTILAKMSSNVFKGFLLGMVVTAVVLRPILRDHHLALTACTVAAAGATTQGAAEYRIVTTTIRASVAAISGCAFLYFSINT